MSSDSSPTKNGTATATGVPASKAAHAIPDAASPAVPHQVSLIQLIFVCSCPTASVSDAVNRRTRGSGGGAEPAAGRTATTRLHIATSGSILRSVGSHADGASMNPARSSNAELSRASGSPRMA